MSEIGENALGVAVTQIGEQEIPKGSNWGHPVQDYLLSVGINFPASWCMAFMYWCFDHASAAMGIENPLFKTGGVLAQLNNRRIFVKQTPVPGSIFILDFGNGLGHCGIVESVDVVAGTVNTIEGNTNDTGSREGFEVCRRERKIISVKAFLTF